MKFNEQLYRKILSGDALTDTEVEVAATHFAALFNMLQATGPEWRLAADAAWKHSLRLEEIRRARQSTGGRYRPNVCGEFVLTPDTGHRQTYSADAPFSGGAVVTRERHEAVLAEAVFEARVSSRQSSSADHSVSVLTSLRDTIAKRRSEDLSPAAVSDIVDNVLNPVIGLAKTLATPATSLAAH